MDILENFLKRNIINSRSLLCTYIYRYISGEFSEEIGRQISFVFFVQERELNGEWERTGRQCIILIVYNFNNSSTLVKNFSFPLTSIIFQYIPVKYLKIGIRNNDEPCLEPAVPEINRNSLSLHKWRNSRLYK